MTRSDIEDAKGCAAAFVAVTGALCLIVAALGGLVYVVIRAARGGP